MKRVNYLNNKDLLSEIHKSKTSYCSFTDDDHAQYDIILPSVDKINVRTIAEVIRLKDYHNRTMKDVNWQAKR